MHTVGAASARRAFASRPVAVLTLCACVVVVGACGAPTAIAFFEEVAWYAQGVADEEMRSTLTTSAASVGVRLEPIVSAEPEPRVALAAALRDRRPCRGPESRRCPALRGPLLRRQDGLEPIALLR